MLYTAMKPYVFCSVDDTAGEFGSCPSYAATGDREAKADRLVSAIVCFGQHSPHANQGLPAPKSTRVQLGHRAAIYCRVSTADQSCERQERDLTAFAGRAGYIVAGIFKETGSGAKLDRAERRKIMALA